MESAFPLTIQLSVIKRFKWKQFCCRGVEWGSLWRHNWIQAHYVTISHETIHFAGLKESNSSISICRDKNLSTLLAHISPERVSLCMSEFFSKRCFILYSCADNNILMFWYVEINRCSGFVTHVHQQRSSSKAGTLLFGSVWFLWGSLDVSVTW